MKFKSESNDLKCSPTSAKHQLKEIAEIDDKLAYVKQRLESYRCWLNSLQLYFDLQNEVRKKDVY